MFGGGELEERRRLIGQNGPPGCFQTWSRGRDVLVASVEFVKFHEL